ncbi:MAG: TIGR01906 family membrane protein [Chloroflexota bacterium]|nr:TIGR01906 family membrane protein [Chloroflexota bacterium]MDE2946337.1 TIGR01906 family membrane protein [Chloroflexota bacterium]
MDSLPALRIFFRLLLTLAVPVALATGAARLLLSEQFLSFEYRRPGFPRDAYGFSLEDRLDYGPYAINYLFNGESIAYLAALRLPGDLCRNVAAGASDCSLFSARELKHMEDVKAVASVAFAGALLCAGLIGASVITSACAGKLRADVLLGIRRGGYATLLSIGCLALLSIAAWDKSFDAFHNLFFAEGTWRFPFSDSLIRLYPEQLFIDAALIIAVLALLGASLILLVLPRLEGLARRRL